MLLLKILESSRRGLSHILVPFPTNRITLAIFKVWSSLSQSLPLLLPDVWQRIGENGRSAFHETKALPEEKGQALPNGRHWAAYSLSLGSCGVARGLLSPRWALSLPSKPLGTVVLGAFFSRGG